MAQRVLENVLEEIKNLQPDELQEVSRAVNGLLKPNSKERDREAALRVLEDSGLVREVKRPLIAEGAPDRPHHPPVPIQGKPLSETIIEERR